MTRAIMAMALVALIAIAGTTVRTAHADDSYTVQDGDTLLAIASKVGVPTSQMMDWASDAVSMNGLADADSIKPGQVLKLPSTSSGGSSSSSTGTVSQTTTSPSSSASSSGSKATPGASYTVQSGDTLLAIAAAQGVPTGQQFDWVASVRSLNGLSGDDLKVGQKLTLPVSSSSSTSSSSATAGSKATATTSSTSSTGSAGSTTSSTTLTATSATSTAGYYSGTATSYAEMFNGRNMGCTGAGAYNPNDTSIAAVGPALYAEVPCGSMLEICGPKACIAAIRKDACPGCTGAAVDLSRAGLTAVCGPNSCTVKIRKIG